MLDNICNMLIEPDSLSTDSSLYLSFYGFASPNPISDILIRHVQNRFPNAFSIIQSDGRISQFDFSQSLKVDGPGVLDLFEVWADFILRQGVFQRNS